LGTLEELTGFAMAMVYEVPNGEREVEHQGETEISWDSAQTVGLGCRECLWESRKPYSTRLLVVPDREADSELDSVALHAAHAWASATPVRQSPAYVASLADEAPFRAAVELAYRLGQRGSDD
jgi:hypothetical protein